MRKKMYKEHPRSHLHLYFCKYKTKEIEKEKDRTSKTVTHELVQKCVIYNSDDATLIYQYTASLKRRLLWNIYVNSPQLQTKT